MHEQPPNPRDRSRQPAKIICSFHPLAYAPIATRIRHDSLVTRADSIPGIFFWLIAPCTRYLNDATIYSADSQFSNRPIPSVNFHLQRGPLCSWLQVPSGIIRPLSTVFITHVYVNPTQRVCALDSSFLSCLRSGNLPLATWLFCFESNSRRRSCHTLPLRCAPESLLFLFGWDTT